MRNNLPAVFFHPCLHSGSLAENGVSSSEVSGQRPSTSAFPAEGSSDMSTLMRGFKQECDSPGSQFTPSVSKVSKTPPSLYSSSSSSSPSPSSSSTQKPSQSTQCGRETKPTRVSPRTVIMSRAAYNLLSGESGTQLSSFSLLPHADVAWSSPLRPVITPNLQGAEQSSYYRQWTTARQHHADYKAPAAAHPRRLLLSGPPQVNQCVIRNSRCIHFYFQKHSSFFFKRKTKSQCHKHFMRRGRRGVPV